MMRCASLLAVVLLSGLHPDLEAQPSGVIAGTVVVWGEHDRHVPHAFVAIRGGAGANPLIVEADGSGRFEVSKLPPGRYSIEAYRPGWVRSYHGARIPWVPTAVPISLGPGERIDGLQVSLARGAAIEGRVVNATGRPPEEAVYVMVLRQQRIGGRFLLVPTRSGQGLTRTDDQGRYRVYGLEPGAYIVAAGASPRGRPITTAAGESTYAMSYHPATSDAGAAHPVSLSHGAELSGIDIVRHLVPVASVTGVVVDTDGTAASGARLVLISAPDGDLQLDYEHISVGLLGPAFSASATSDEKGEFTFSAVAPGQYEIRLSKTSQPSKFVEKWAQASVSVSGERPPQVFLRLDHRFSVGGSTSCAHDVPPPAGGSASPPGVSIRLERVSALGAWEPGSVSTVGEDGRFTVLGVEPGRYIMRVVLPDARDREWFPASVMLGGQNLLDEVVELTQQVDDLELCLTRAAARISGALVSTDGIPVPELSVLVFSTDESKWMAGSRTTHIVTPDSAGGFHTPPLPDGDYYVAALALADLADVADSDFLREAVPLALTVSARAGRNTPVRLVIPH